MIPELTMVIFSIIGFTVGWVVDRNAQKRTKTYWYNKLTNSRLSERKRVLLIEEVPNDFWNTFEPFEIFDILSCCPIAISKCTIRFCDLPEAARTRLIHLYPRHFVLFI